MIRYAIAVLLGVSLADHVLAARYLLPQLETCMSMPVAVLETTPMQPPPPKKMTAAWPDDTLDRLFKPVKK